MATIVSTELKVYTGTTTSGTQVGSTITKQGSPATVNLNSTELGVALSAGTQYCVVARCQNDESFVTDWTNPYAFKTLIYAEILTLNGGNGHLNPELQFTYDTNNQDIYITECGVYVSTSPTGTSATRIAAPSQEDAEQGWTISTLQENTTYYVVPFVVDQDNREYMGDWADAESASTGYNVPTLTISNVATTYNSISGNVAVATNDTVSAVYATIVPTGGGTSHTINLTAATGTQTWTITDGDTDRDGNTITINSSTEYRITIYATNTHGGTGSAQATATTAAQSTATIAITSITGITPTSAVANLSYSTT